MSNYFHAKSSKEQKKSSDVLLNSKSNQFLCSSIQHPPWDVSRTPGGAGLRNPGLNKLTIHVIAKFIHKRYLEKLLKNFNDYFTLVLSVHSRTRNSLKLYQYFIPQFFTYVLKRGVKLKGSKIGATYQKNSKN